MLRVFTAIALLAGTAALATEPGAPAGTKAGALPAATSGTLRFRLSTEPATLDANLAHNYYETYVSMNLMEGLVEEGPALMPRPALAEKWSVSSDGLTYTFTIRKGVKWTDGKPLRAQEFVDSWTRL